MNARRGTDAALRARDGLGMTGQSLPEKSYQPWQCAVPSSLFSAARDCYQKERFEKALTLAHDLLRRFAVADVGAEPADTASSTSRLRDVAILAAWSLYRLDRYDECRAFIQRAVGRAELPVADPEADLIELWIHCREGSYERARQAAESFLWTPGCETLSPLVAEYLFLLGTVENRSGKPGAGLEALQQARSIFKLLGKLHEEAEVANSIGTTFVNQGRFGDAMAAYIDSLRLNKRLGLRRRLGQNLHNIGICAYKRGHYKRALAALTRALKIHRPLDARTSICRVHIARGNVRRLQGDFKGARQELMNAYRLATELKQLREECLTLEVLGDTRRDEGKPEEAAKYYTRGLTIARRIAPEGDLVMELRRRQGECLFLRGKEQDAVPELERAQRLAQAQGDRFEEGVICRCLAQALSSCGQSERSIFLITQSEKLLASVNARHELALAHLAAARIHHDAAGQAPASVADELRKTAWEHGLEGLHIFRKLDLPAEVVRAMALLEVIHRRLRGRPARARAKGERRVPHQTRTTDPELQEFVAASDAMKRVVEYAEVVSTITEPVLIIGETGTGKELIAKLIHAHSERQDRSFVAINCAAVPGNLFEREFFGHHRGAYSGASDDTPGFAAAAHRGTLFLDELGEMPLAMQPKLLRLIQEGTYRRLGDPVERRTDIRLISATNKDLRQLVAENLFRTDLYYRVRVVEIPVPPLRRRPDDIIPLMELFLRRQAGSGKDLAQYFSTDELARLQRYHWPGNVRELESAVRCAVIQAKVGHPMISGLDWEDSDGKTAESCIRGRPVLPGAELVSSADGIDPEFAELVKVLRKVDGNKAEAARRLGISRPTLYRRLRKYGL